MTAKRQLLISQQHTQEIASRHMNLRTWIKRLGNGLLLGLKLRTLVFLNPQNDPHTRKSVGPQRSEGLVGESQ